MNMIKSVIFKLTLVIGLLTCMSIQSEAQKGKYKLAERYFVEYNYKSAVKVYEDILKKNSNDDLALRRLAICHERLGNLPKAEKRLAKLIDLKASTPEDLISYANVLKKRKKYEDAIIIYKRYSELRPDEEWVKDYYKDGNWTFKILRDSSQFVVRNSGINTKYKEFAPGFLGGDLVFSSSRPEGTSKKVSSGESYLNLFKATIMADGTLKSPSELGGANSKYHESNGTYDPIEKTLYFTRNNINDGKKGKSSSGKLNLAIFYASFENGELGKVRGFKYNDPEYSVGQTAITPDGQRIIFVSDMPGGYGGTDLYYCEKEALNWGEPINFGPEINTPGNEMAPFVFNEDLMYFASNGHPGLGGLDVFVMDFSKKEKKAKNMGYPVNTAYDDFGFVLYEDAQNGFIASDRPGGKGQDDLYEISIKSPDIVKVTGRVIDAENQLPIQNATILLKDAGNVEVMQVVANTDVDGNFDFEINYNLNYTIIGVKNGYFQTELFLETSTYSGYIDDAVIELTKYDYASEGKVLDVETGLPIEGALVSLMDDAGNVIKDRVTEKDGRYFFGLYVGNEYILKAEKENYSNQDFTIDTRNRPSTVIYSDFRLFKLEAGTTVPLENILWDYNSAVVTSSSKVELNRVVEILNEYPTMTIELSSHTDSQGGAPYNLKLSNRRANSAGEYLISQGIDAKRIVSKGYGESKLKNHCADGVKCSDAEHQENRRTEFTILKI